MKPLIVESLSIFFLSQILLLAGLLLVPKLVF